MNNSDMPAMPQSGVSDIYGCTWVSEEMGGMGLTKREYFAGLAMQAIEPPREYVGIQETRDSYRDWAGRACRMADALLAELETTP